MLTKKANIMKEEKGEGHDCYLADPGFDKVA